MSKFAFLYERYIERFVVNLVVENESNHSLTDSSIDFEGYCLSLDNALFFRILSVSKNQYSTRYTKKYDVTVELIDIDESSVVEEFHGLLQEIELQDEDLKLKKLLDYLFSKIGHTYELIECPQIDEISVFLDDERKAELYHLDLAKKTIIRSIKSDSLSVFSLPDKIVDSYGDSAWSEAISDIFDNRESYDFTNSELKTLEYLVGI